jgi:hypothetical protein
VYILSSGPVLKYLAMNLKKASARTAKLQTTYKGEPNLQRWKSNGRSQQVPTVQLKGGEEEFEGRVEGAGRR